MDKENYEKWGGDLDNKKRGKGRPRVSNRRCMERKMKEMRASFTSYLSLLFISYLFPPLDFCPHPIPFPVFLQFHLTIIHNIIIPHSSLKDLHVCERRRLCLNLCTVSWNIVFLLSPVKIRKEEVYREEKKAENRPESRSIHDAFVFPTSYKKQQQR